MSAAEPGVVYAEERFTVLRNHGDLDMTALPEEITPAGLPLE